MIICGREIADGDYPEFNVVVVGSGAVGIPLAMRMAEAGLRILLLEAGGENANDRGRSNFSGLVREPKLHPPTDKYRQRCLGGTTGIWGGRCVPFDNIDMQTRSYIPFSGWPISIEDVRPFFDAANEWLEAGFAQYESKDVFSDSIGPLIFGFESSAVSTGGLERFSRPTNLYSRYKSRIEASTLVTLTHGATCTRIALDEDGKVVRHLVVVTSDGREFLVRGKHYVIAAGGIETARLLLSSNDIKQHGVGNESDVVGRYYMCHIAANIGQLTLNGKTSDVRHGYEISPDGIYCRRRISLTESEQLRRKVNNVVLRLHFPRIADPAHRSGVLSLIYLLKPFISYEYSTRLRDAAGDSLKSLLLHLRNVVAAPVETVRFLSHWIRKRIMASRKFPSIILENKTNVFSLEVHAEHCPRADSHVFLIDEKDELGMPRIGIDWKYSAQDIYSVKETLDVLAAELARQNIGELQYDEHNLERDLLRFGAYGGHHIGTARMGSDPATSVVDSDCKVHTVDNLFIAGSAVFPTSSQANPTLMATALALRLADHLAMQVHDKNLQISKVS